jgi:hypothetical protein
MRVKDGLTLATILALALIGLALDGCSWIQGSEEAFVAVAQSRKAFNDTKGEAAMLLVCDTGYGAILRMPQNRQDAAKLICDPAAKTSTTIDVDTLVKLRDLLAPGSATAR